MPLKCHWEPDRPSKQLVEFPQELHGQFTHDHAQTERKLIIIEGGMEPADPAFFAALENVKADISAAIGERRSTIAVTEPRSPQEQTALDAALFERTRADRYEMAMRRALLDLGRMRYGFAARELQNALLP